MNIKERFYIYFNSTSTHQNQEDLFTYIWENYSQYIGNRICIYKNDTLISDIDDIKQEVFIKIFNNLDKYNPAFSFTSWINRIIKNHIIDLSRKNIICSESFDDDIISNDLGPLDVILRKEQESIIENEISKIKKIDQRILNSIMSENKSYSDTAMELGITEQNLRVRIHRLKQNLKNTLGGEYEF